MENVIVKIKEYNVGRRGLRGAVVSLPQIFINDNDIQAGDSLEFYRGNVNGKDSLIIQTKRLIEDKQPAAV